MAAVWMYDASLYANVRLFFIYFRGGERGGEGGERERLIFIQKRFL